MFTVAHVFASHFDDDGQKFTTDEGEPFEDIAALYGASVEYWRDCADGTLDQVCRADAFTSDRVRYVFRDGSAVVAHGDGWDIEGDEPGVWENA